MSAVIIDLELSTLPTATTLILERLANRMNNPD